MITAEFFCDKIKINVSENLAEYINDIIYTNQLNDSDNIAIIDNVIRSQIDLENNYSFYIDDKFGQRLSSKDYFFDEVIADIFYDSTNYDINLSSTYNINIIPTSSYLLLSQNYNDIFDITVNNADSDQVISYYIIVDDNNNENYNLSQNAIFTLEAYDSEKDKNYNMTNVNTLFNINAYNYVSKIPSIIKEYDKMIVYKSKDSFIDLDIMQMISIFDNLIQGNHIDRELKIDVISEINNLNLQQNKQINVFNYLFTSTIDECFKNLNGNSSLIDTFIVRYLPGEYQIIYEVPDESINIISVYNIPIGLKYDTQRVYGRIIQTSETYFVVRLSNGKYIKVILKPHIKQYLANLLKT